MIFDFLTSLYSNRSSDSAKYTNKSSGTSSILSANIHHTKFYAGNRHRDNNHHLMTTSVLPSTASVISTAPVHKKFVNKTNCDISNNNHCYINRFINNNSNSTHLGHNNNHYSKSLSLNRHSEVSSTLSGGVGCISSNAGTLTSPYAYTVSGCNKVAGRSTKSDIGVPIDRQLMKRNLAKSQCHNKHNSNNNNLIIHKSKSILLPSVYSDLSLYESPNHPKIPEFTFHKKDILNNNYSLDNPPMCSTSALKSPSSKTGSISKLTYTNRHRFNNLDNPLTTSNFNGNNNNGNDNINVSHQGPLVYKNDIDDDLARCDWNNSVFDNPIMTVSQKLPTPPATNYFHIQCETLL